MLEILPVFVILRNVELISSVEIERHARGIHEVGVLLFVRLNEPTGTLVVLPRKCHMRLTKNNLAWLDASSIPSPHEIGKATVFGIIIQVSSQVSHQSLRSFHFYDAVRVYFTIHTSS